MAGRPASGTVRCMTTTFRLLAALTAATAVAAAAPAAHAAPRCPAGKTAWSLEGRSVCVKAARTTAAAPSPLTPTLAGGWLRRASAPAPTGRTVIPRAMRRSVKVLPEQLTALARRAATKRATRGARLRAAGGGGIVGVEEVELDRKVAADGTTVITKGKATLYGDESKDLSAEVEARSKDGRTRVIFRPRMDDIIASPYKIGCPTADGIIKTAERFGTGGTVIAMDGGRVLGSQTNRETFSVKATGHVGRDARLEYVDAVSEFHLERYERGLQLEITAKMPLRVAREGAATPTGAPSVDVRVRALHASAKEERAYEREQAASTASDPELAKQLAWHAKEARDGLVIAEARWYNVPNDCADVSFDPPRSATIEEQQRVAVQGYVYAKDGGAESSGTITVTGVDRGSFTTQKADTDPGDRARFTAIGGAPTADYRNTVNANVIATSRAGRAQSWFSGYATEVKLPKAFTGTIASAQVGGAVGTTWSGTATYTRRELKRDTDGTVRAWYDLTQASLTDARSYVGMDGGCRLEARRGGGTIDAGDLEVWVKPDGTRLYALLYDVKVEAPYAAKDCPPGAEPPGYDGEIAAVVHSRTQGDVMTGGGMRPFGSDLRIDEPRVTGILGSAGMAVAATWTLTPVPE